MKKFVNGEFIDLTPEELKQIQDLENFSGGGNDTERKWIKIADVITEEDVHSLAFTELPEDISDIYIFMTTKYANSTNYDYISFNVNDKSFHGGNIGVYANTYVYNCRLEIMDDGTGSYLYTASNLIRSTPTFGVASYGSGTAYIRDDLNQIVKIGVSHSSANGLFAKGTKLKIWVKGR